MRVATTITGLALSDVVQQRGDEQQVGSAYVAHQP
jgi:hypothetical protein